MIKMIKTDATSLKNSKDELNKIVLPVMADGDDCFSGEGGCDVDVTPVTLPVLDGLDIPVPTANAVAGCRADTQV